MIQQTEYLVTHKTNEYPTGLKDASEVAQQLLGMISDSRLVELADSGYVPHYRIDGGPPKFKVAEVKQWISENLLAKCQGRALPSAIRVVINAPPVYDAPPSSICHVPGLQQLPKNDYQPGVYFLCRGSEVVYVGQSVSPASRISSHIAEGKKDFDRVYLLPVPQSELNDVEGAFILHLLPSQQGGIRSGKKNPTIPNMTKGVDEVLQSVLSRKDSNDRRNEQFVDRNSVHA